VIDDEDREIARRNLLWGWGLLALFVLIFVGAIGVALLYLQLD